ncbi:Ethanolamine utilization protein EutN/carboxysome [Poriferisphaera corsica]|uniref:Ethanolamine utilization protein EutN/carboxysome n=1 Tax=Poriferisphaera corsica TaxID=2528020 RepID=A0A517YUI2_9BACT|nr:EutN/CcmL family microcompartment protein [Poriferisphaera corsica]QDU33903.1 Ethanolamine utilization protein EutN/carboxysome [Poriferisphaera corsica]
MRIGRVIGHCVLDRKLPSLAAGRLLLVDVFDNHALHNHESHMPRKLPMPQSLVVYDELGAGIGSIIAISEGAEATMPFYPERVPVDAYASAILDQIELHIN